MNLNMYHVVKKIPPSLAVIDGWIGMEGNGPISGTPVKMGIVLASTDFVVADTVATCIMGFDPSEFGYITYANRRLGIGDLKKISIVGEDLNSLRRRFKSHQDYEEQRKWHVPTSKLEKLLQDLY